MPGLETLQALLRPFSAGPPELVIERCLNRRWLPGNVEGCHICADVCPVVAITVNRRDVTLDPDACELCGLCLHACPAGAFTQPGLPLGQKKLLDSAAAQADATLELVCPLQEDPHSAAPVEHALLTGHCLAALSLADLIDLVRPRRDDLWLDDSACEDCPLAAVLDDIQQTITQANALLAAWEHPARIRSHSLDPDRLQTPRLLSRYDSRRPPVSRRAFFNGLRHIATTAAATVAADALAPPPTALSQVPPHQRLKHHLPRHRRHLTAALQRLGQPASGRIELHHLPWAELEISDACSACQLCTRFCPTAALQFITQRFEGYNAERFGLFFVLADCVDCGICFAACPEDAITSVPEVDPHLLATRTLRPLQVGDLATCQECGTPISASVDQPVCHICRGRRYRQQRLLGELSGTQGTGAQ